MLYLSKQDNQDSSFPYTGCFRSLNINSSIKQVHVSMLVNFWVNLTGPQDTQIFGQRLFWGVSEGVSG